MNILSLLFIYQCAASDHFSLYIHLDKGNSGEVAGFRDTNQGMVWTNTPILDQVHFTCSTCTKNTGEEMTSIQTTDSSAITLSAKTVPGVPTNILAPFWGSGKTFAMGWNPDGTNVTFYASGMPMEAYCASSGITFTYLLITDVFNPPQPGYVLCSTIGELSINWSG